MQGNQNEKAHFLSCMRTKHILTVLIRLTTQDNVEIETKTYIVIWTLFTCKLTIQLC